MSLATRIAAVVATLVFLPGATLPVVSSEPGTTSWCKRFPLWPGCPR